MNKTTTQIGALLSRGLRRVKAKLRSALIWCRERKAEHETTEALRSLDDRLLRDIGIDRYWNSEQVHTRMTPVRDTAPVVEIKSGQPEIQHYTLLQTNEIVALKRRRPHFGCARIALSLPEANCCYAVSTIIRTQISLTKESLRRYIGRDPGALEVA